MSFLFEGFLSTVNLLSIIGMIFVVLIAILIVAALMIVIGEEIEEWLQKRRDK